MTEYTLWLDNYTDIYSDFDSRHYLKRRISDDFLRELKVTLQNKEVRARDLVLLLPKEKRKETVEKLIAESLASFFTNQHHITNDHYRKLLEKNLLFFFLGIALMISNVFIGFAGKNSFGFMALRVLLEPAGWFFVWSSLDFLFNGLREIRKERSLYQELSELNIHFRST